MRWVICAGLVLALAPPAFAEDFGVLRGTEPTYHWGGFYAGGQVGFSSAVINFGRAGSSEIAFILRQTTIEQDQHISQWTVLGSRKPTSLIFGAFAGYNYEWEGLVLGGEVNYNHTSISGTSTNEITRSFSDSTALPAGHHYFYTVTAAAMGSLHMSDIATFRARAALPEGNFLPYAFAGFAVGRTSISNAGTITATAVDFPDSNNPPLPPLDPISFGPVTLSNQENNLFAYGIAVGLGTDIALTPNIFVRGEYEYLHFFQIEGSQLDISSVRVGAGLKF